MDKSIILSLETQVSAEEWLTFIRKFPDKDIFQTPYIKNVFEKTKNYKPYCFFARDENNDILASLFAYTIRDKVPLSFFSRRAIVDGEILFVKNKIGKLAVKQLIEFFCKKMKKHAIYAEIRNRRPKNNIDLCFKDIKIYYLDRVNILIDLNRDSEIVWKNIQRRRRKNIKQAIKRGVIVRKLESESEMRELYMIVKETYTRNKTPMPDESLFMEAFRELVPKKLAYPLITELEGRIIGGSFPLLFDNVISGWFMSGLREFSSYYHQNDLVVWEILKWGSENGYTLYDFGGGGDPQRPSGLRDFKLQLGGRMTKYSRYQIFFHPYYYKISKSGYKIFRKVGKGF